MTSLSISHGLSVTAQQTLALAASQSFSFASPSANVNRVPLATRHNSRPS